MFERLGEFVSRGWWAVLLVWIAASIIVPRITPEVKDVVTSGEFNFLPDDSPSRQAESLFRKAFPDDKSASTTVIVLTRSDDQVLSDADLTFIEKTLKPALRSLMVDSSSDPIGETTTDTATEEGDGAARKEKTEQSHPYGTAPDIISIQSPGSAEVGKLLLSEDRKAALVTIDATTEFLSFRIRQTVTSIEDVITALQQKNEVPEGLKISLSGSAVAGRDIGVAQSRSADSIEHWTLLLIVSLLLVVYRAPLPVLVPLATLVVSLQLSMRLLAFAAQQKWIGLFEGVEVYTIVVAYGAGVDFSMFLTSRFHEEIQRHNTVHDALVRTIKEVGPAILAAASTVIFGIGMMVFAIFGKFHQAGISISFSLFIILCAALTFTPSMLRMMGRYTFWPEMPLHGVEFRSQDVGFLSRMMRRITMMDQSHQFWESLASFITRFPIRSWILTVLLMLPWTVVGVWNYEKTSYGLISSLSRTAPSVLGTAVVEKHFSLGLLGPVALIIEDPKVDFSSSQGQALVAELTENLKKNLADLQLSDVRSSAAPLGLFHQFDEAPAKGRVIGRIMRANAQRVAIRNQYNGEKGESGSHVTRVDLLLNGDPFLLQSIRKLDALEGKIPGLLPEGLKNARLLMAGSTPSIRDLKAVASEDRWRITILVTAAVFFVLLLLIRSLADSIYLMATVIFSFLCTMGVTYLLFYSLDPAHFPGLDWTVPTFLFTILVAVGQDYNIFLVTRIHEERATHGPLGSVRHAVVQTAAIITSCGLIMAGTFSAMIWGGELAQMTQLGFALAFGVLLDTMVVRPILVPAYFAWRAGKEQDEHRKAAHPEHVAEQQV